MNNPRLNAPVPAAPADIAMDELLRRLAEAHMHANTRDRLYHKYTLGIYDALDDFPTKCAKTNAFFLDISAAEQQFRANPLEDYLIEPSPRQDENNDQLRYRTGQTSHMFTIKNGGMSPITTMLRQAFFTVIFGISTIAHLSSDCQTLTHSVTVSGPCVCARYGGTFERTQLIFAQLNDGRF